MSSLALPAERVQAQAPLDPKAGWITPEQQLNRLYFSIAEKIGRLTHLNFGVARIVAEYVANDEWATNWHTALNRLNSLPEKIPPLPANIFQILNSRCPIYGDLVKAEGKRFRTFVQVKDTHFLALILEGFGNLNRLERDILIPYGRQKYPGGENPLQFRCFWETARQEHANVPFPDTHWVLMTKDVLPGSRNKPWNEQLALVNALRQKDFVDYEIPTLQQGVAAITTDMVATGERRYPVGDKLKGLVYTYTRVQETTHDWHLIVGGFAPSGVRVNFSCDYGSGSIGVAALRKF
ncbi:MAG: hypothetical protein HW387_1372 [Parachlamydiales bacterium]|nr:hypothetical protein [Parachlamydiales bacterium]